VGKRGKDEVKMVRAKRKEDDKVDAKQQHSQHCPRQFNDVQVVCEGWSKTR
jgi:hypothetical protein